MSDRAEGGRSWPYEVAERDHDIQNPTSAEKIRLLGEYMRLSRDAHVLDVASGRGGPALILAEAFGCRITGVELREAFVEVARERARKARLESRVEFLHGEASELTFEPGSYDVAMCLGASFVFDGLEGTLAALVPAVRPHGYVALGEPYWRTWPLPNGIDDLGYVALAATAERFDAAGLRLVGLIAASEDDWDRYESLHWRAMEEWLEERPDDELRRKHQQFRDDYLRRQREHLGWAILVGWKQ